ncbi:MAG: TRAP transporter small permease, partial [Rhodospirillaceae bacterium]
MNDPDQTPQDPRSPVPVRVEEALAALCMALICLISLANVVVRYLSNVSFAFTEEFSVFLMVAMTFLGASVAFARGQHIRIAIGVEKLPRPLQVVCELVVLAVSLAMFSLIIWYGGTFALDQWE